LGAPSSAVYRKFQGIVHPPDPVQEIATNWGGLRMPARILVIREGAMGDVLLTTPIVRKLFDDRQGNALIDIATKHPAVFRNNPCVNLTLDPKKLASEVCNYDLIIDLDGVYERNPAGHIVDAYAFHAFGDVAFNKQPELFPNDEELRRIQEVVADIGQPYLVIHKPDHHWRNRNLPMGLWRNLIDRLLADWPHAIVQIGGPSDTAINGHERLLDHRANYSLQELQQLIAHSNAFVGVDAGPSHVAATTNTPMCIFFTSAHHAFRKPLRVGGTFVPVVPNVNCYGCQASNPPFQDGQFCRRGDNLCVDSFDSDDAVGKILSLLATQTHRSPSS
jgi:ADP-heptose:LPS heptosyltransferase